MYLYIPKGTRLKTVLDKRTIMTKKDIKIPVETRTIFEVSMPEFGIYEECYDLNSLDEEIKRWFAFDYEEYGLAEDRELCESGLEYKHKILELFEEVDE